MDQILTLVLNAETMVSSQLIWFSITVFAFQFGYGDNSTVPGSSPGTTSAIEAGFPGFILGTVTNTLRLVDEMEVDPELIKYFSSDVSRITNKINY